MNRFFGSKKPEEKSDFEIEENDDGEWWVVPLFSPLIDC